MRQTVEDIKGEGIYFNPLTTRVAALLDLHGLFYCTYIFFTIFIVYFQCIIRDNVIRLNFL